jgi:nitroreductase
MGSGIDGGVRWLPEEGEAEVANKGVVREGGAVGQLLTMAREMGSGPVRRGGRRRSAGLPEGGRRGRRGLAGLAKG